MWLVIALAMFAVVQPSQPTQATPVGTGVIKGRVIDEQTGAPLVRALVMLRSTRTGRNQQDLTDDRGRFEFTKLPPASYDLRATPGDYRATHVFGGYVSPSSGRWELLELRDGEERANIVITLARARAISGRVTDEAGDPLANVEIMLTTTDGNRIGYAGVPRRSDDRGMFRLHGVAAGRYRICAAASRGLSFDPQTQLRRLQYVQTCYPSAAESSEATDVAVADQDVSGIEIRMQRRPTYVLRGQVTGADGGPPENARLSVTRIEKDGSSGTSTPLRPDGTFAVSNVTPGTYEVSARIGRERYSYPPDDREPQWGTVRVAVTSADIEGLVVRLKEGATLNGTVVFEDPPQKSAPGALEVSAEAIVGAGGNRSFPAPAKVGDDGAFELRALFGPVVLRIATGVPPGYVLKAIRYRGRDIADTAMEFDGDPAHRVEVVLTSRTAELSGQVVDESGAPAAGVTIIPFPVDAARWKGFRGVHGAASVTGRYRIPDLVAGDYFVAAVSTRDQPVLDLPEDYDRLAAIAERITVLERERRTADLQVKPIPPGKKQP